MEQGTFSVTPGSASAVGLVGWLFAVLVVAGCSGHTRTYTTSPAEQRRVAAQFANALLRGDAPRASRLLVSDPDGSRAYLVRLNADPWKATQSVSVEAAGHARDAWTFRYVRRRTQNDGTFQTQRGDLAVLLRATAAGARVEYFVFSRVRTRFSTHHDSLLLPSNR
jgi:hypothetical protein